MAIKLSSLKINVDRERDGDWVDIPDLPGVRLKVRGFSYKPFQTARSLLEQRLVRKYGSRDPVPVDVLLRENGKLYAEHILLGWEGLDEDYSPERALEILTDPGFRIMHDHIRYAGERLAATDPEFVEEAAKN